MSTTIATTSLPLPRYQKFLLFCIFFHVIAQCFLPSLERKFYWGEFFVLLSSFSLLLIPLNSANYQRHLLFLMSIWVFLFPIYGLLISLLFWPQEFEFIYYLRHLSYFYYGIFFFFAFKTGDSIIYYLRKWGYLTYLFPITLFIFGAYKGSALSLLGFMLIALSSQKKKNSYPYYLGLATTIGIPLLFHASGTNKVILTTYVGFLGLPYFARFWTKYISSVVRRTITYTLVIITSILAIRFIDEFYDLTAHLSSLGLTLGVLNEMSEGMGTDGGGFWRLVLWSHLYGRLLDYPWGVGLGTPLFENWVDGFVLLHLYKPGENYVQGAHNSFVTFIARLGIPALILFSFIFFYITKITKEALHKIDFKLFYTNEGRLFLSTLFVFLPTFLEANFNVTLESPLHAGIFWFSFGLFTKVAGDIISRPRTSSELT